MKSCWSLLGVEPGCGADAVRRAFAEAARKHHPEDDPEGFIELQKAYREALRLTASGSGSGRSLGEAFSVPSDMSVITADGQHAGGEAEARPLAELDFPSGSDDRGSCPPDEPGALRFPSVSEAHGRHGEEEPSPGTPAPPQGLRFPDVHGTPVQAQAQPQDGGLGAEESGRLHFPRGRAAGQERPPSPAASSGGGEPRQLAFPPPQAQEQGQAPDGAAMHVSGSAGRGEHGAGADGALVFPLPLLPGQGMPGAEELPLLFESGSEAVLPYVQDDAPMSREAGSLRQALLEQMAGMARAHAGEQEWLDFTGREDFALFMHDPGFLGGLAALCAGDMSLPLCSALYAAYGLSSQHAPLRRIPVAKPLVRILEQYAGLPADGIPHAGQEDTLARCRQAAGRIRRLMDWPQSGFLWQQYLQTEEFCLARYQPYFIGQINKIKVSLEFNACWQSAYAEFRSNAALFPAGEDRACPDAWQGRWEGLKPYAGLVLQDDREGFYDAAGEELLSLVDKTARHFRFSERTSPWEYVFGRPQFVMLRFDRRFIEGLAALIEESELPSGFYACLDAAYGLGGDTAPARWTSGAGMAGGPDSAPGNALGRLFSAARKRRQGTSSEGFWQRIGLALGKGR